MERKEINRARFRTETEGNSADYIRQVGDTRSGPLCAGRCGELHLHLQRTIGNQAVQRLLGDMKGGDGDMRI